MPKNKKLFTIYGARLSASGKFLNLSLVRGENDNKEFINVPITLDESKNNYAVLSGEVAIINVKMLKQNNEKMNDDDLPF